MLGKGGRCREVNRVEEEQLFDQEFKQFQSSHRVFRDIEGQEIVDFLVAGSFYELVGGNTVWRRMEKARLCRGNRNWQGLKDHFNRKVLPNLNKYKLQQRQIDCFKASQDLTEGRETSSPEMELKRRVRSVGGVVRTGEICSRSSQSPVSCSIVARSVVHQGVGSGQHNADSVLHTAGRQGKEVTDQSPNQTVVKKLVDDGVDVELEQLLDESDLPSSLRDESSCQEGVLGSSGKGSACIEVLRENTNDEPVEYEVAGLSGGRIRDTIEGSLIPTGGVCVGDEDIPVHFSSGNLPDTAEFCAGLVEAEDGILGMGGATSSQKEAEPCCSHFDDAIKIADSENEAKGSSNFHNSKDKIEENTQCGKSDFLNNNQRLSISSDELGEEHFREDEDILSVSEATPVTFSPLKYSTLALSESESSCLESEQDDESLNIPGFKKTLTENFLPGPLKRNLQPRPSQSSHMQSNVPEDEEVHYDPEKKTGSKCTKRKLNQRQSKSRSREDVRVRGVGISGREALVVVEGLPSDVDNEDLELVRAGPSHHTRATVRAKVKIVAIRSSGEERDTVYKNKFRTPYSREEDEAIINFLLQTGGFCRKGGTSLWKEMERSWICPGRTWQSLKQRFLAHIGQNLASFGVTKAQLLAASSSESDTSVTMSGTKRYTSAEDKKILDFIVRNKRFDDVNGVTLWQAMETRNFVEGRTWQSLKERFRKVILKRLRTYGLEKEDFERFLR